MIVVDTSALLAVVLKEAQAEACEAVLKNELELLISAGTMAEALIVAGQRRVGAELSALVGSLAFEIEPVTSLTAQLVGLAYTRWGRGVHPAGLNFGDCFAYALAAERDLPLLYIGNDFAKTDIRSAITRSA